MGSGKNFWVENVLCKHFADKKILMLSSRTQLRRQIANHVWKYKIQNMETVTYQYVNQMLFDEKTKAETLEWLQEFDVIVCDEVHYWISDSAFTKLTELSYNAVLRQTDALKIMMTATADDIISYLKKDNVPVRLYQKDMVYSGASRISFFSERSTIERLIEDSIKNRIKTIVFIQSSTEAMGLYQKYQEYCQLITSDKRYQKFRNADKETAMRELNTFEDLILTSTLALEVGFDFKDRRIKRIITDIFDPFSVVQCIGRKRQIDEADTAEIFIRQPDGFTINGYRKRCHDNLKAVEEYQSDPHEYFNKRGRTDSYDAGGILVPVSNENEYQWTINQHRLHHTQRLLRRIERMQSGSYKTVILEYLKPVDGTEIVDSVEDVFLSEELATMCNETPYPVFPTKEDKQRLIDLLNVRTDGRQRTSKRSLNQYLESHCIPYMIGTTYYKDDKDKVYRHAWELYRTDRRVQN